MKVLHVTSGIDPASGGPTRSVKGICRALSEAGQKVTLLVLNGNHVFENSGCVRVEYAEQGALAKLDVTAYDLVHLHGLWDWRVHIVARECQKSGTPYVVSPRGMLDPWALTVKKWKKKFALWLYQMRDLRATQAFHVTANLECEHVRAMGLRHPCIIAPNGVAMPSTLPSVTHSMDCRTAIFLSRLHPGKGLLILAEAWARVQPSGWRMKIVGPDTYGHKAEVINKLSHLGILESWSFVDALDDTEKWSAYRSANLLVHPSVSENFGITIVEGLYAGLPVIATRGTPWQDLVDYGCGWWIEQGVDALSQALQVATSMSDQQLQRMGEKGHQLILKKYQWPEIAQTMIAGYERIMH